MDNKDVKIFDCKNVLSQMTLEEKARLVNGATFFGTAALERLNIPALQLLDGGTGINFEQLFGDILDKLDALEADNSDISFKDMNGSNELIKIIEYFFEPQRLSYRELPYYLKIKEYLTNMVNLHIDDKENKDTASEELAYSPGCYPAGILLGSTWNEEIVEKVGEALGIEAVIFNVDILLGSPNVNILRDPLNGRFFEGYSEDPYLVSVLAPGLVRGVQKYGVAANVKHFAANNQETNRIGVNERISRRALEEIYFPGFKACVDAGVKTVMSAYNKINDIRCNESKFLLQETLREKWGFKGLVMSDWGAVFNPVLAILAGNDLAMPGPRDYDIIVEAVKSGELDEENLDASVLRILELVNYIVAGRKRTIELKNEFMPNVDSLGEADDLAMMFNFIKDHTDAIAYEAASEGIVLLKNDGVLPLCTPLKVEIISSDAVDNCGNPKSKDQILECGNGSAGINTDRVGSISESLGTFIGRNNVSIIEDLSIDGVFEETKNDRTFLYILRISGMEGNDKKNLKIPEKDVEVINHIIASKSEAEKLVLVLNTSGPVEFTGIDINKVNGIIVAYLPGMGGVNALVDILMGEISPSGRLAVTFPARYEDTPTFINFPGDGFEANYGEGIFVGYRYYDKKKIKPLYPFGFGLSYTTFSEQIESIELEGDEIVIKMSVTNEGEMEASQVIQVYVSDVEASITKPVKELKAFKKVFVMPNETVSFELGIKVSQLASYDTDRDKWIVEEGYYDIIVATSSSEDDELLRAKIYIDLESEYSYGVDSQIKVIYEHSDLKDILIALWQEYSYPISVINAGYQYTSCKTVRELASEAKLEKFDEFEKEFKRRTKAIKKR